MAAELAPSNIRFKQSSLTSLEPKLQLTLPLSKFALRINNQSNSHSTIKMSASTLKNSDDKKCKQYVKN